MRVDQLLPAFHRGDAIGDEAVHMRDVLRRQGHASDIYCLNCDPGLEAECRPFQEYPPPSASDAAILHFALPSPLTQALSGLPCKKAIVYHNITPPEFFADFNPDMALVCLAGRRELAGVAGSVDLALADSEYNCCELRDLGFKRSEVFPLFVDFSRYERPHSRFVTDLFKDGRVNILFVGRVVPNKRIENLIKVAFYYKKYISPLVRLIVVGKTQSLVAYYRSLQRLADEFYLKPEEVHFAGHIPEEEMMALYRASDVFLSLSEHEGFCLPLIESMVFDLPIVALNSTAVPFTLDGAGILVNEWRVEAVAELAARVARDPRLREAVIQGQRRRLAACRAVDWEAVLARYVRSLWG
ncbi:MAG: glycosyltransferase family 4 protein [Candidatus Aminicenantes bacterium]|nr:glycosyltransferase family 4 protein [Candidatus Aminicenantes bacterium]